MTSHNPGAPRTYLEPGHHSVDRCNPTPATRRGKPCFRMEWHVRLHDGLLLRKNTEGQTKTAVRTKARRAAERLLAAGGSSPQWKPGTPIERYIDEVSMKEITDTRLRPRSARRYRDIVLLLRQQLAGRSISATMHYDILAEALDTIGYEHGPEAARQSKSILGKYLIQPLRRHRLVTTNPIQGLRLDLGKYPPKKDGPTRGGQGLSAGDQERVIRYLLALDPAEGVEPPGPGPWTIEHRITRNRRIIDLTLLQIGTGLRVSEALKMTRQRVVVDDDGYMYAITGKIHAKTHKGRYTPVLDSRIQKHLQQMVEAVHSDDEYLFGRPSDPMKFWPPDGGSGASGYIAELYQRMATELDIPCMQHLRTHLWRTTLGSRCQEAGIARKDYADVLGHDPETNEKYYTDDVDLTAFVAAYRGTHRH